MNRTLATAPSGLASGSLDTFQTIGLASVLEVVTTFGVASFLARTLNSQNYTLHGAFNILLLICCQGVLPQPKTKLLVVILGSIVIKYVVGFWPAEAGRIHIIEGDARSAGQLTDRGKETKVDADSREESNYLQPMIFPSRTTHRRLFPIQHAFGYSYLLVGVPVSNATTTTPNPMLSTHPSFKPTHNSKSYPAWLSVNASDYLQRGRAFSDSTLRQKLDLYLETEGVRPDLYPYVYLVTAPRFLGFSFNPVSFWYLYDKTKVLAAMILEVNNTFDERRMYFLQRSPSSSIANSEELETRAVDTTVRFTQNWPKDFHVSPFNDRDGSYSVTVGDITAKSVLDNTIVLRSDDNKPKIIARIYSTERGIDPAAMSLWRRTVFLLRWFWVGFMTNPRILKEARVLWIKKLQVFYRPEPLRSNIGRNETPEEGIIEEHFRRILNVAADQAGVVVEYSPAAGDRRGQCMRFGGKFKEITPLTTVRLQILTPKFYSELARECGDIVSVFKRVCFQDNNSQCQSSAGNPLVWTDNEDAIRRLFNYANKTYLKNPPPTSVSLCRGSDRLSQFEYAVVLLRRQEWNLRRILLWIVIRSLGFQRADQEFKLSEMDKEVESTVDKPESYVGYLWSVLGIILIDRLAFGFRALFRLELRIVRFITVVLAAQLVRFALHSLRVGL